MEPRSHALCRNNIGYDEASEKVHLTGKITERNDAAHTFNLQFGEASPEQAVHLSARSPMATQAPQPSTGYDQPTSTRGSGTSNDYIVVSTSSASGSMTTPKPTAIPTGLPQGGFLEFIKEHMPHLFGR